MMAIAASMLVERTERGDEMFMTMLRTALRARAGHATRSRCCPPRRPPEPLQPDGDDEAPHASTDEALWNESWYFDFADPGQGVGGWVRLGLYPNEGRAWINALLCGPGIPTIALNDFEAQVPDDPADVRTDDITLTQQATEPLQSYRVTVAGSGQAHDDPVGAVAR